MYLLDLGCNAQTGGGVKALKGNFPCFLQFLRCRIYITSALCYLDASFVGEVTEVGRQLLVANLVVPHQMQTCTIQCIDHSLELFAGIQLRCILGYRYRSHGLAVLFVVFCAEEEFQKCVESCFESFYGLHHDVGFMFQPTAVADYRLTGNKDAKRVALHAANLLAGRFNPVGKFIRAWNDLPNDDSRGWAIIDCMFNISLLHWASRETNDPRFSQIAVMHTDTVMKNFIRADGSIRHIVEFDSNTGAFVCEHGGQGYANGSSWTREQGWAVYGFANSYANTGKAEYLDAAKRVAHYCMANMINRDFVPVDFRQPELPAYEDSCGACVIAGGLLEIAKHVSLCEKEMYVDAAVKILKNIAEHRADWSENCDAIVQNCTSAYHAEKHHQTMVYADYYFIEALYKLAGDDFFMW